MLSGMLSGDIQIGWTASAIIAPIAEGADFVIVAGFNNRVTDELVVKPGIKRPEDLRGKRLGVQSIGGGGWMGAMLGLEYLGLEPRRDDIRVLVVGDSTVRGQALEGGSIDATFLDGAFSRKVKTKGFATLADFSQANIPIMNHLMAVKKSYLQRQPEIVENVLRALIEGLAFTWAPKNKSAVLKSVMRRLRITDWFCRRRVSGLTYSWRAGKKTSSLYGRSAQRSTPDAEQQPARRRDQTGGDRRPQHRAQAR